jgi:hypothetical protein
MGKTTTTGGGEDRVLTGRDVAGTLRAPGHRGSTCGGSCEGARGLEESEDHRRPRIVGAEHLTGVGRDVAGTLRAPGHHGSTCGVSCEGARGLEESEDHRRPRIVGAEHLTGVGFGSNSGVGRARGLMQKPWTAP